ncbi:major facilitator superfamily domain-containing protein [Coprinopsis sp. MPI-PUGE-AT-0042]|nr:major facilitator superfamily domain-containing protein [Coprinopsis sp. MPI-PUGE-AT-0042]
MSSSRRPSGAVRSFGRQDVPQEEAQPAPTPSGLRRVLSRLSFASSTRRPSFLRAHDAQGEDIAMEQAPIPSTTAEANATPLPLLSMIVLSITMLSEFLSANVSTPFLLFMVRDFGELPNEAEVAFWTGIIVATFFLTQFMTSLLWATVAEKHGRRAVLVASLGGGALTVLVFGTATSLKQAICIRLLQGIFAGSVGVARGSVAFITDPSNEGRAYAILGFCWGFGGVAGAIVGGSFERPADKWPGFFGKIPLFVDYPYLLPCAVAAGIMAIGSLLGCFLGPDGGPRTGAIQLPIEKDNNRPAPIPEEESSPIDTDFEEEPVSGLQGLTRKISRRFSNMFANRVPDAGGISSSQPPVPLHPPPSPERQRAFSRTSRANGSAYGYNGGFRNRLASAPAWTARRGSLASTVRKRRGTNYDAQRDSAATDSGLNFAQRLLLANENAVTNIADLWVAAAINAENEDPFESDSDGDYDPNEQAIADDEDEDGAPGSPVSRRLSQATATPSRFHRPSTGSMNPSLRPPGGIFAHVGVRTPPAMLEAQRLLSGEGLGDDVDALGTITEGRTTSSTEADPESLDKPPPSLLSQLPLFIIVQYVTLTSGGLNLNAGHFAQLIALMCFVQIALQFYLYPNMGPPRGRFSHLAMFRIGSIAFIPSYLTVVLYRPLASAEDGGNFLLMCALALSTAVRYCGIVFGYTSISILLNYMTPPAAVGYANGVAQSIVSLARCFGPVLGGYLWSSSVEGHPSGYYMGFLVCSAVCAVTVIQSFLIR